MKRLAVMLLVGIIALTGVIGCETHVHDHDDGDTTVKRTTVRESDGDRTTRTEIRRD
jgi:hypothetical protein